MAMALPAAEAAEAEVLAADYDEDEGGEEPILVGCMTVNVVGLQHYQGTVTGGEMVELVREPTNVYDGNAIRALNVRGLQVGHIERGKAMHLAPLVDSGLALLEGVMPYATGTARFKLPCEVSIFSRPALAQSVLDHLQGAGERLHMPEEVKYDATPSTPSRGRRAAQGRKGGEGRSQKRKMQDAAEMNEDQVFEDIMPWSQKRQTMEADAIVKAKLMDHQKQALAWMVQRENVSRLPPFWELQPAKGKKPAMYLNKLTNFSTDQRPESLRGGILADDMGLGKTLTVLALIATNRPGATLPAVTDVPEDEVEQADNKASKKSRTSASASGKGQAEDCPFEVPKAGGPRATLVVCPVSVMSNWIGQLEEHFQPGALNIELYHGPNRVRNAKKLANNDVVFTSFNTLGTEFSDRGSPLLKVHWLRVVLDEAHLIKNPAANQTKSAVALNADRRWAVTGTPIQNSSDDLYSLMQFLHFEPLSQKGFWKRTIQRPLNLGLEVGINRLRGIMGAISLRRTKNTEVGGRRVVELPPKIVTVHHIDLDPEDRTLYDKLRLQSKCQVSRFIENGTMHKKYAVVMEIILRLRQICDHSSLFSNVAEILDQVSDELRPADPQLLQKMLAMLGDEFDCPICLSPPTTAIITKCAHVFCRRCIEKTFTIKRSCPMCRAALSEADIFVSNQGEEQAEKKQEEVAAKSSAKISALISLLQNWRVRDPSIKSVVFSQFTKMLVLLKQPLTDAGFKFVTIDGSMSTKNREKALEQFKSTSPDAPTVFLLSLKAAGVGLNLVTASNVFMLDPWWNPAAEDQAMDRVHRLGQTRDVHVYRLVAKDTIEENMLKLQEKKRALAQAATGKKGDKTLSVDDVVHLLD